MVVRPIREMVYLKVEEKVNSLKKDLAHQSKVKEHNEKEIKYVMALNKKFYFEHDIEIQLDEQMGILQDKYDTMMNYKTNNVGIGSEEESLIILRII